jgi:uncharacterized damage-inducible protein DinB
MKGEDEMSGATNIVDIVDELKRIHEGDAWHGPALLELLLGVRAEQAAARPIPNAHSIWELVLHIIGWENVFRLRLQGQPLSAPPEGDFPPVEDTGQEAWTETLSRLDDSHAQLINMVGSLSGSTLKEKVAGKDYTTRFLISGIVCHHVYHAGQIALLKKAFIK